MAVSAENTRKWLSLSFDVGQSKIVLLKSLAYLFLFFSVLIIVNSTRRLKLVLAVISGTGIFQAVYGTLEVLLGIEKSLVFHKEVSDIATGTFVYKNHFANYLVLTLSAAIGYLVASLPAARFGSRRDKLRQLVKFWLSNKVLFRVGIIFMVIALVMSRSRMGNSAFFIGLFITATLGLFYFKPRRKSYVAFFISMLVIDILILSSLFGLEKVQQRIKNTSFSQESRDEVVSNTLPLISEYALFGAGGGTFYTLFPQSQPESIQHFYDHAHNEYIQFLLEFGVLGSSAIALVTLICLISGVKAMKTRRHPIARGSAFAAIMAIVSMLIHSTLDFPLQAPANTFIFIILLAIGIQSKNVKAHPAPTRG
ncbi:O-antigen ligase family protein [Alteromonas sp.]|uniref:O-antigen ligase family protein n=1 Tax=Alteromonas sp. TaxID=232 RepID=UPI00257F2048|nr:O-antigen ligase family protein [Alteromonas sp.]